MFQTASDLRMRSQSLFLGPSRTEILDSLKRCLGVTGINRDSACTQMIFSELNNFLLPSTNAIFKEACENYYVIVVLLDLTNIKPNIFFSFDENIRQELYDNYFSVTNLVKKANIVLNTLLSLDENI